MIRSGMDKAGVPFAVRQAAVWIVTDNADYDDLGIFVSRSQLQVYGGTRQIREYESAKAMRICEEAGINIIRKAIWRDRHRILSGLKDEELRQWIEKRGKETEHLVLMYELIDEGDKLQKQDYWCNAYSAKMTHECRLSRKAIIAAYSKAIQAAPGYAEAYYKRGRLLRNISAYPTNARWEIFLDNPTKEQSEVIKKYLKQIDKEKLNENLLLSIKDLSIAIKIDPSNTSYFYVRAYTYIMLGDFDKAFEDYNRLIQLAPREAAAYFYRAISRISDKPTISDYDLAIKDFTSAINLDPEKGHFYSARAKTWLDMKRYNYSIADYRKSIELGYSHAGWDYYYFGIALTRKKLFDESVNAFNLFLKEFHPINWQGVQARKDAEFRISQLAR